MKNKIIAILIAILVLLNCTPIYANTINCYDTIEEIKTIDDYIMEYVNSYTEILEFQPINKDNLDYKKVVKLYSSTDILENNKLNNDSMTRFIENKKYAYIFPIVSGEKTIELTINKGEELTEEKKASLPADVVKDLEDEIGKWTITSIGASTSTSNYIDETEKKLAENQIVNANVYFVNRISKSIGMTAIICPDNGEEAKLIIQNDDKLYTFDEIKAIAQQDAEELKNLPENSYGDGATPIQTSVVTAAPTPDNNKIIIISAISGVAVLAIAIAAICIVKKKKHTKVNNEE